MDSPPPQTLQDHLQQIILWLEIIQRLQIRPGAMDFSPPQTLRDLRIIEVRKKHVYRVNVPCSLSDLRILRDYVSSLGVYSEFSPQMYEERLRNEVWDGRFKPENYTQVAEMVVCFLNDLKELFKIPIKLQHDEDTLKKNIFVAGFLEFLSRFLTNNTHLCALGFDGVLKELRCFAGIFRDKLFQAMEHEQVQCISMQFEELVNKAGRFVHSYIFSSDQLAITVDEFLSKPISLFKHNMIEFFQTLPNLPTWKVAYYDVDSFFIIGSLLDDLEDSMNPSDNPLIEVKDQIEKLRQGLLFAWPLLEEHLENKEFKEIAVQIRDMAYQVEHVINSFLVEDVPIWYLSIILENVIPHIGLIGTRAQELKKNYDAIRAAESFGTQQSLQGKRCIEMDDIRIGFDKKENNTLDQQTLQGGRDIEIDDDIMIGFEKEEENILDQLLRGQRDLQIISIVGTPGLGKTTLAKKLHYHHSVGDRFDRRCWCVVSEVYQRKTLLRDILKNLGEEVEKDIDEQSAKLRIHKVLYGRRYLITLDDIWTSNAWDDLQNCFPAEQNGSRILITSRNRDMAPTSSIINSLPFLSKDQCWQIIKKRVFYGETCPPMLESIGMDLAAKCKGLPLLATVVAGILSKVDREPNSWNIVRDEVHSYGFLDQENPTLKILLLSYKHLSQHLKPCLLYFGMFREDIAISTKKLKQLWIAEGFIHKYKLKDPKEDRERVAEEYLMELINKSLVMVAKKGSNGKVKACAMHDLLREMCLRIVEEENFLKRINTDDLMPMPNRYSSDIWLDCELLKFNRLVLQSQAKVFHPFGPWIRSFFCSEYSNGFVFVDNMKLLRVLDCQWGVNFVGIENLVKLRYLATRIVPKSIKSLVNLESLTVDIEVSIPSLIQKMLKLRYLKAKTVKLDSDCDIFQANNLEFLSFFLIENARDEEFLKYLPHLCKLKCGYSILNKAKSASPSFDLSFLTCLLSLSVTSFYYMNSFYKSKMMVVKFPTTIIRLTFDGVHLSWKKISMIGELPNLEILKIEHDAFMGKRWVTREGEFKKLRILNVRSFRKLEEWNVSSKEHFPNLQQLILSNCFSLKEIPREIGNIETLQLIEISSCKASVAKSVSEIAKEQENWENDSLKVLIFDTLRDDDLNVLQG